jgi:hypothetical protein
MNNIMKKLMILTICIFNMNFLNAEEFKGGEITNGDLTVKFSSKGIAEQFLFDGVDFGKQHPGGISLNGSATDQFAPWLPQSGKTRDLKMLKEEKGDYTLLTVSGRIVDDKTKTDTSYVVENRIYADKYVQDVSFKSAVQGPWVRGANSYWVNADVFAKSNYKAKYDDWKVTPLVKHNRNLASGSHATESLELVSEKYRIKFLFSGVKASFFDDRKPNSNKFNFEFAVAPQPIEGSNPQLYGGSFSTTIEFSKNKSGKLPLNEELVDPWELTKGDLTVKFSPQGVAKQIIFDGSDLCMQHPNGISLSGSAEDMWAPWLPQYGKSRDFKMEKTEKSDYILLEVSGRIVDDKSKTDTSYVISNKVYSAKFIQEVYLKSSVAGPWRRGGNSIWIDGDYFVYSNYKVNGGDWQELPVDKKTRNLATGKNAAETLELVSERFMVNFIFKGMSASFFDERKPGRNRFNFEFSISPEKIAGSNPQLYGGNFSSEIEFAKNKSGKLPLNEAEVFEDSVIDLQESDRLIEKSDFRTRYTMDGKWDILPVGTGSSFPDEVFEYPVKSSRWKKADVPVKYAPAYGWDGSAHAAWYRTDFVAPEDLKSENVYLHLDEVQYKSIYYVNGKKAGEHDYGYIPIDIDISRFVKAGETNTLEIFVADFSVILEKSKYPDGPPKTISTANGTRESIFGLAYGSYKGIQQSVFLDVIPKVYIEDVFVKTSYRKMEIASEITVTNTTTTPKNLTVKTSILDGDTVVKELPSVQSKVAANSSQTVEPTASWKDPKLWGVKEPNLYFVKTEILDGDKVIDSVTTRFGFREFWIDGISFYLNGYKIKLRECATHMMYHPGRLVHWSNNPWKGQEYEAAKAEIESIQGANFNTTRMVHQPHPKYFYDITDELGHLAISHMPAGFWKTHLMVNDPRLHENTKKIIAGLVKKERNHPSIIIWDAENEGLPYGEGDASQTWAKYYAENIGAVCKELSPERPVKYDGDGDLLGRADIIDIHGGDVPNKADMCTPNSNWEFFNGPYGRMYGRVGGTSWRWAKDKPVYFGEGLYWMGTDKGPAARYIGERVYDDIYQEDQWYRGKELYYDARLEHWKITLPIWRMMDAAAGYCPWSVKAGFGTYLTDTNGPGMVLCREVLKPERFFLKQWYRNFYAGSEVNYDFAFINDDKISHDYKVKWQLLDGNTVLEQNTIDMKLHPADVKWEQISFKMPNQERKSLTLNIVMVKNGKENVHEEDIILNIFPREKLDFPDNLKISLFDPNGNNKSFFEKVGLKFNTISNLEDVKDAAPDILIIAENAFSKALVISTGLDDYVESGGKVLVFAQSEQKAYGPFERFDDEQMRTRAFTFKASPTSPLLENVSTNDLIFWNHSDWQKAHNVSVNARTKFIRGNAQPVIECDDLWFAPLQELYFGKGLYIECSLDLFEKYETEPVAAIMIQNIFNRLADFKSKEYKQGYVLRDKELTQFLNKKGLEVVETDKVPEAGVLLVSNDSRLTDGEVAELLKFAEQGNTVWLHSRKGADSDLIGNLLDTEIKVVPYSRDWRAREVRRTDEGKMSSTLSGIFSGAIYERNSVDDIWKFSDAEGIVELATGGAVVEKEVGKGKIVLERISWDTAGNIKQTKFNDYFLNVLATNLGIEIDIFRNTPRVNYTPEDFHFVDLSSEMNRDFRDDVSGDGKGGWTDQGDNDLRGMPTGQQTFHKITFDIVNPKENDSKACLVMYSEHSKNCPKETSEISIDQKAKALFFLHTAAWYSSARHEGKALIDYIITYEDGTKETAQAIGGRDIKDWWSPGNCEEALGVSLLLMSDTEVDAVPRRRGLLLQTWENPHPEKVIKSLKIKSRDSGAVPIVMGVSLLK